MATPKAGLHVENIFQLNKSEEGQKNKYDKKFYFSVAFYENFMIKYPKNAGNKPANNSQELQPKKSFKIIVFFFKKNDF